MTATSTHGCGIVDLLANVSEVRTMRTHSIRRAACAIGLLGTLLAGHVSQAVAKEYLFIHNTRSELDSL